MTGRTLERQVLPSNRARAWPLVHVVTTVGSCVTPREPDPTEAVVSCLVEGPLWTLDACLFAHESDAPFAPDVLRCVAEHERAHAGLAPCEAAMIEKIHLCEAAFPDGPVATCVSDRTRRGPTVRRTPP